MNYAYARVSATDQNLARQLEQFTGFGIEQKNIYSDKLSGKDFNRAGYKKMLKKLKKNDLLVIKSIDRLGRNYAAIYFGMEFYSKRYRRGYSGAGYAVA